MADRGINPVSTGKEGFIANPTASKKAQEIFARWKSLKNKRSNWEWQWQDSLPYTVPHKAFVTRRRSIQGEQLDTKIYDSTARIANQLMASGFQGNLTNPATRWFNLRLQNKALNDFKDVKIWLSEAQDIMFDVFSGSNFDEQIHECYIDLGSAGTSVLFETEDIKDIIRFKCLPVSEVSIGEDSNERVIEVYRQFTMTAQQAQMKWGKNAGKAVEDKMKAKKWDDNINFLHSVHPRHIRDIGSTTSNNLEWAEVFMELEGQHIVSESGFHENPYMVTRFFKVSGDPYGYSPGIIVLPDIKMLQAVTKTIIEAAQKITSPPLILPHDGFLLPLNTEPNGINYRMSGNPNDKIEFLQTGANIPVGREEQLDLRDTINKAYFVDLFMTLADRRNMTATEVVERVQEKMLMLGPVLGRLQTEMLDPIVERTFNILLRKGIIPPPPAVLENQGITVEYISPLSNAQRSARVNSITNILSLTGQMAQFVPEVIDKIDTDKAVDQAADVFGVNPNLVRNPEQVAQIRQARQEQLRQAQEMEALQTGSAAAKDASEAEKNLKEAEAVEK